MSKVITFSRVYPSYHPKAGQPTNFVEKIYKSLFLMKVVPSELGSSFNFDIMNDNKYSQKHHTIRAGNRFKVGDKFSPRVWGNDVNPKSGRSGPYHSKQIIIAPCIEVKKVFDFVIDMLSGEYLMNGKTIPIETLRQIAINDGFENLDEFELWFDLKRGEGFIGQIICWNENINYSIPINSNKKATRKYYLHRMIKRFATIRVGARQILVPENKIESIELLKPRQKKYLNEIRNKYGYTIQATIQTP